MTFREWITLAACGVGYALFVTACFAAFMVVFWTALTVGVS